MANVSLKTDFKDGDVLYDYHLNNNFSAIMAALQAMNKITWQDTDSGVGVSAYKGNTDAIEVRELIDGQLLYNTETGETYIDTYVNDVLTRINTGSGNVVAIQETEPTNEAVKLWIEEDSLDTVGSEITNEYSESTKLGYSANYLNGKIFKKIDSFAETLTNETFMDFPVYQVSFFITSLPNASYVEETLDFITATSVVGVSGFAMSTSGTLGVALPLPYASPTANENIGIEASSSNDLETGDSTITVKVKTGIDRSSESAIVTVKYIKPMGSEV